jgi:PGF-CTERM protein
VNLTVVNALLDSEQISPGEVLTVTAVVENTGETAGDARVALVVNGLTVATERVELAAGESARVTFDRRFENRGTFEIAVGDTTAGQVVVATPTPSVTETVGTTTDNSTSSSFPGFGPAAVVAALLAVALLARRRGER